MPHAKYEVGQVFGRLTLVSRAEKGTRGHTRWVCKCECGNEKIAHQYNLRKGSTLSCGCLNKERVKEVNTVHGRTDTRLHLTWRGILARCLNPNGNSYKHYGGRGITVCERWMSFENFLADMGEKPEGKSIERIDVNGNYEPANCKWASPQEQGFNRRGNKQYLVDGEWLFLKQLADKWGVSSHTAKNRINRANYEVKITGADK